jgi:hypothetical protein
MAAVMHAAQEDIGLLKVGIMGGRTSCPAGAVDIKTNDLEG